MAVKTERVVTFTFRFTCLYLQYPQHTWSPGQSDLVIVGLVISQVQYKLTYILLHNGSASHIIRCSTCRSYGPIYRLWCFLTPWPSSLVPKAQQELVGPWSNSVVNLMFLVWFGVELGVQKGAAMAHWLRWIWVQLTLAPMSLTVGGRKGIRPKLFLWTIEVLPLGMSEPLST